MGSSCSTVSAPPAPGRCTDDWSDVDSCKSHRNGAWIGGNGNFDPNNEEYTSSSCASPENKDGRLKRMSRTKLGEDDEMIDQNDEMIDQNDDDCCENDHSAHSDSSFVGRRRYEILASRYQLPPGQVDSDGATITVSVADAAQLKKGSFSEKYRCTAEDSTREFFASASSLKTSISGANGTTFSAGSGRGSTTLDDDTAAQSPLCAKDTPLPCFPLLVDVDDAEADESEPSPALVSITHSGRLMSSEESCGTASTAPPTGTSMNHPLQIASDNSHFSIMAPHISMLPSPRAPRERSTTAGGGDDAHSDWDLLDSPHNCHHHPFLRSDDSLPVLPCKRSVLPPVISSTKHHGLTSLKHQRQNSCDTTNSQASSTVLSESTANFRPPSRSNTVCPEDDDTCTPITGSLMLVNPLLAASNSGLGCSSVNKGTCSLNTSSLTDSSTNNNSSGGMKVVVHAIPEHRHIVRR